MHDDVIKRKHFPRYWSFVRWIHRSPVNSTHKGQWRRALMFSLICAWIYSSVNNREAGDLRRHCAHYGVIVVWAVYNWGVRNSVHAKIEQYKRLCLWCHVREITIKYFFRRRFFYSPPACIFNTLRPRQNARHFAYDIFECMFVNENAWISLKISLKFVL